MLRHDSFHPNDNDQYYELTPAGTAHTRVTEYVVERALSSHSVRKAPGPDKLYFGTIQLLWKWDKQRIVEGTDLSVVITWVGRARRSLILFSPCVRVN